MKIRRTAFISLAAMAVFVVIGASVWDSRSAKAPSYIVDASGSMRTRVRKEKLAQSLFVAGELAPAHAVRISVPRFRERGQVPIQSMAPEGSIVKAGDALLQIDNAQLIASLNSEEINLDKAENDLAALQIRAPVAGTVVYENAPATWNRNENDPPRKFQVGDQVSPGQIVMSVVDLSEMEVRAFVSEVDGGLLRTGQRARIVVDSHAGTEFTGAVDYVPEVAERLRRLSNVRVFIARLKLDSADPKLMKPGMSVRVEITLDEREGLALPRRAVLEEGGKFYAYHSTRGKTEIKVTSRNAVSCLIKGLQEGDEVIAQ